MNDFTKTELRELRRCTKYIINSGIAPYSCLTMALDKKLRDIINHKNNKEDIKMNFSEALEQIKAGKLLKRSGWNGKDQFVFLVNGSEFKVNRAPLLGIFEEGTDIVYRPHIDMKYQDGSIGMWLASMGDLMAEDWEILEDD